MIEACTAADVRAAERPLLDAGVPLMDRAAFALATVVARELRERRGRVAGARVALLVGAGNNGGDALFAGVYLRRRGVAVTAYAVSDRLHDAGSAALERAGGAVVRVPGVEVPAVGADVEGAAPGAGVGVLAAGVGVEGAVDAVASADVVLDAVLGTGARGALRGTGRAVVEALGGRLARAGRRPLVVAVDVPSGIGTDDGTLPGPVLPADLTVTFGAAKRGLLLPPAAQVAGRVEVVDIGLAAALAGVGPVERASDADGTPARGGVTGPGPGDGRDSGSGSGPGGGRDGDGRGPGGGGGPGPVGGSARLVRLEPDDVAALWPQPSARDQKYSRGVLGVVAGTSPFPGAAVLTASAAVRAGAGMVRYVGPEAVARAVVAARPEVVPTRGRVQAWALGPGLPAADPAADADSGGAPADVAAQHAQVRAALDAAGHGTDPARRVPAVVDAGALSVLPEHLPPSVVLTPHAGELAALLRARGHDVERAAVEAEPLRHARLAHAETGATVLLKGSVTVVVGVGVELSQAEAPAWLGTAGAGDVLTGLLGVLLAARSQAVIGDDTLAARLAAAAASVHGLAARAANPGGPVSALAVADALPGVVARLLGSS